MRTVCRASLAPDAVKSKHDTLPSPRAPRACEIRIVTADGARYDAGMIIAIDGPAASGKGTLARRLAARLGYAHLDTGGLYRAVALALLLAGDDPEDAVAAETAAGALDLALLDDPELRAEGVGRAASVVSAHPGVRAALLDLQRDFAARPPAAAPGAVLDGRDIGTVVCPDADIKFFITADLDERARRRHAELQERGVDVSRQAIRDDLADRDRRDSARAAAPLKAAPDAVLLDTTKLDIDAVLACAIARIEAHPTQ